MTEFLLGKNQTNTTIMTTHVGVFDTSELIDWDVPKITPEWRREEWRS